MKFKQIAQTGMIYAMLLTTLPAQAATSVTGSYDETTHVASATVVTDDGTSAQLAILVDNGSCDVSVTSSDGTNLFEASSTACRLDMADLMAEVETFMDEETANLLRLVATKLARNNSAAPTPAAPVAEPATVEDKEPQAYAEKQDKAPIKYDADRFQDKQQAQQQTQYKTESRVEMQAPTEKSEVTK